MNAAKRALRDKRIVHDYRAGIAPRTIASRNRLTLMRVQQILRTDHAKRRKRRHR